MKTSATERFLRYVTIDTRSDEHSSTVPSTPGQLVLLRQLAAELQSLGLADAVLDDYGYVMATVPATASLAHLPAIGFIVEAMLFGIRPLDPITFVLVTIVLGITAALSIVGPAWRAARIDPAVALRNT